jgi:prephenate dehydrogenase
MMHNGGKVVIGIRGMGLIGGSFQKAFNAAGHEVVDLKSACRKDFSRCRVVIVCLPPMMVAPWIKEHAADFADGALVTDAAGIKAGICAELEDLAASARWTYVGGHPMAGREVSGYSNSVASLFNGASMIFTPYPWTDDAAVERLKEVFSEVGFARFTVTDPARHDEMIAYTSQLAHVVSSAYIQDDLASSHAGFSAGSFQDMTRVATVDPDLWTDLFLSNAKPLDLALSRLIGRLMQYRDAVNAGDPVMLRRLLQKGREAKESVK